MRYSEIIGFPRHYDPKQFPTIVHIDIDPAKWDEMQIRVRDQTQIKIIGHDEGPDGLITVHAACTTAVMGRRLEARWSA